MAQLFRITGNVTERQNFSRNDALVYTTVGQRSINQSINQNFNASWQTATRRSEWIHNCTTL